MLHVGRTETTAFQLGQSISFRIDVEYTYRICSFFVTKAFLQIQNCAKEFLHHFTLLFVIVCCCNFLESFDQFREFYTGRQFLYRKREPKLSINNISHICTQRKKTLIPMTRKLDANCIEFVICVY